MYGRGFLRGLAVLLLVAVAAGLGTMVYNAGVNAGLDEAARLAAASGDPLQVPIGYGYGYGGLHAHGPGGFGFFGLIFGILGIFLLIGLVRAAFGGGRWGGRGPGSPGGSGGWGGRREMVEEWHREMHERTEEGEQRTAGA
jgi:hypothetical protein